MIIIENVLKYAILYHAAPTLLNLKPATLINFTELNKLYQSWRHFSRKQLKKFLADLQVNSDIEYVEIRHQAGKQALVLFYNTEILRLILSSQENRAFLARCGYQTNQNATGYFNQLSLKILQPKFPDEIGIFLGIPVEDVVGFITNRGKNYLFNQYWKVYQSPLKAKKIFASYDDAKIDLLQRSKKISNL